MEDSFNKMGEILYASRYFVFFGGAGVSVPSGIPDFRGPHGIYTLHPAEDSPEYLLSHSCLRDEPEKFFRYYREMLLLDRIQPNVVHRKLAQMEEEGILKAVITQNIDGLHSVAGSKNVYELHGSANREYCVRCRKKYSGRIREDQNPIPRCECGGMIRPDVVLYEEALPDIVFDGAEIEINKADTLLVAGTSLQVYPAAGLIRYFRGKHLFICNLTPTPFDHLAEMVIREDISTLFSEL